MRPFEYQRVENVPAAIAAAKRGPTENDGADGSVLFLAGGTTLLDLMKIDVLRPSRLVDLNALQRELGGIEADAQGLQLGALARMSVASEHPGILRDYPLLAQSLRFAASPQLRNMATLGGNVLQRTRCTYYRDPSYAECNKRVPGSGCAALSGCNRRHAVLGVSDQCIASYPGDLAQALVALDASVELLGPEGRRSLPFEHLHRAPGSTPNIETTLAAGELIVGFRIPALAWSWRSLYLKIRDRQAFQFALASVAIALDLQEGLIREARIALGGVATRPWRAREAEAALQGQAPEEAAARVAAEAALRLAVTHGDNDFKPELARRAIVRAVLECAALVRQPDGH